MTDIVDVVQTLHGISYEVCSTNIATSFHTWIIYSSFEDTHGYTPAGCCLCCYVMRIYEIRLYPYYSYMIKRVFHS